MSAAPYKTRHDNCVLLYAELSGAEDLSAVHFITDSAASHWAIPQTVTTQLGSNEMRTILNMLAVLTVVVAVGCSEGTTRKDVASAATSWIKKSKKRLRLFGKANGKSPTLSKPRRSIRLLSP